MASVIAVVDDDISVRESLGSLIRSAGLNALLFTSAEDFLSSAHHKKAGCLILDVRLPGISGIELNRRLIALGYQVPVVFITAHGYGDKAAQMSLKSTIAYLMKPFSEDDLLGAVEAALKWRPDA